MADDGSLSIEELRAEVENDQRFKTVYRGFDKKSVNAYIKSLENEMQMAVNRVKAEVREAENKSNEMRVLYLQGQQEVKLAKIQKNKEIDAIKAEYDAKIDEIVEEKTKSLKDEFEERINKLQSEIEAKQQELVAEKEGKVEEVQRIQTEKQQQADSMKQEFDARLREAIEQKEQQYESLLQEKEQLLQAANSEKNRIVEETIAEEKEKTQQVIDEKNQRIKELEFQINEGMEKEIARKDRQILELNNKLKNREEAAKKVEESIAAGYKAQNESLTAENNKKKIRIAELEEKLSFATTGIDNNINMLDSLNENLREMLASKFSECEDILSVWTEQFKSTSKSMRESVAMDKAEE